MLFHFSFLSVYMSVMCVCVFFFSLYFTLCCYFFSLFNCLAIRWFVFCWKIFELLFQPSLPILPDAFYMFSHIFRIIVAVFFFFSCCWCCCSSFATFFSGSESLSAEQISLTRKQSSVGEQQFYRGLKKLMICSRSLRIFFFFSFIHVFEIYFVHVSQLQ